MIEKTIENTFRWKEPSVRILALTKSASEFNDYISTLKEEPGHTKLLMLALGAGEYYGCNRNGDYFPTTSLEQYSNTFETHGYNYKHHVNKDPNSSYGKVIKSYWNPRMKRVELIVDVLNDKAPDIIQRVASDELIPVSMACRVPFDICSICHNKAPNIKAYCEHLKYQMGQILENGKQVYAINTEPIFFDISYVFKPADRTAHVLAKVASVCDNSWIREKQASVYKQGLLQKLSAIEKELENIGFKGTIQGALNKALPEESISPEIMEQIKSYPKEQVLGCMAKDGIILSLPDFLRLLVPSMEVDEEALQPIKKSLSFSSLLEPFTRLFDDLLDGGFPSSLQNILKPLKHKLSLLPDIAEDRALQITITRPPKIRVSFGDNGLSVSSTSSSGQFLTKSSSAKRIADAYSAYKLASAAMNEAFTDNPLFLSLVVSRN